MVPAFYWELSLHFGDEIGSLLFILKVILLINFKDNGCLCCKSSFSLLLQMLWTVNQKTWNGMWSLILGGQVTL